MVTISLCMIVKNEEDVLDRCLSCVRDLVDEIIIVDTGSADQTKEIARKYTDRLFSFQWIDDFSAARNYAFSKATMDYCMWLDADDVIEEKDRTDFLALKQSMLPATDVVMMRYNTGFNEDGTPSFWYYRERIVKNDQRRYFWQGAVHEVITPSGFIIYSDAAITHRKLHAGDSDRNLNIYKKMIADGKILNARENYYYARELYYHQLYEEALYVFDQFISQEDAWLENKIEACTIMAKCCQQLGDRPKALRALLRSLELDAPRAEVCCEIGSCFMEQNQYETAIFWLETALNSKADYKKGGFILPDSYNYTPAMQLCVCCDKLGRYEEANVYNELAGTFKPNSPAVAFNREYFEKKKLSSD